jgi:cellulose synthase/poly-beta-1,6-N-acetylglucosamine synthase-like glycosyltransferase
MLLPLVSLVFLAGYACLIFFYYRHWRRLQDFTPTSSPSVFVSVIVAARNEEKTLPLLLQDLQAQDYPSPLFEVLIVNDFSTDGTALFADVLPRNFHMITPQCLPEQSSKKRAITTGVERAKGALLLITDADCRVGKGWLSTIASFYVEKEAAFIAAPVKYIYQNSLLQVLQVLDFITLQGITAASVAAHFHSMCNGANLAYTKKAFESVNGFEGIDQVPTGDDMLLMHKIWKQQPAKVFYLKSKEAIVSTVPMQTWKEFFMQRRRWASKTLVYDDKRIMAVLFFVLLLNLLPFVLLVAAFYQSVYWRYLFIFLFGKTLIEWPFVSAVARFYDEQKLMRYFFLLQPLHVFYTVLVGIWSQLGRYEWKGRTPHLTPTASPNPSQGGAF